MPEIHKDEPRRLRTRTDYIGGPKDGHSVLVHCSGSRQRVPTARLIVFSVYREDSAGMDGRLVFQGYEAIEP